MFKFLYSYRLSYSYDSRDHTMKNLIIDCETLGVKDNAIVPMFAAMVTDDQLSIQDNMRNLILLHPSVPEQEAKGSVREEGTELFWSKQPKEVFDVVMSQEHSISIDDCYTKFKEFLKVKGYLGENAPFIWQRGSKDLDWLSNLFNRRVFDDMLPFGRVRDIRTGIDVLGASSAQNGYMDAGKVSDEGTLLLTKMNVKGQAHHPAYDVVRDFVFLRSLGLV